MTESGLSAPDAGSGVQVGNSPARTRLGSNRCRPLAESGKAENGFKALAVTDDVSEMDLVKIGSGTESFGQVSATPWQNTVLTSCVLTGCLALIAVLTLF